MKIKEIPQDFIVNEIFDIEQLKEKDEGQGERYYYFILKKTDYSQIRALEIIANIFNTSRKLVHFAGNKDKVGITTQLISVRGISEKTYEKNMEYFKSRFEDLDLEFLGKFKSRVNLGDNLGNQFQIVVRDLEDQEIEKAKDNLKRIEKKGVLNLFDSQRFGYANNSHIVGKYILQNEIESAVKEILTSCPPEPSEDLEAFTNYIENNWEQIKEQNEQIIDEAILLAPKFLKKEQNMLEYLKTHTNDFSGAFRKIHKKLRTIYVNAYQSYIFNETITQLYKQDKLDKYQEIPLVSFDTQLKGELKKITEELMQQDNLTQENFNLPSMPELKAEGVTRDVKIDVDDLKISREPTEDELNEVKQKITICFKLKKGAYATNVIKQLFL